MSNLKTRNIVTITLLCVALLLLSFGFTACEQNYSANSIKSNLENAGYTVSEGEKIVFTDGTDTTTLAGLQKIYFVAKGSGDDKEYAVVIVFDSIGNADKLSDAHMIEIAESAKQNCGDNKSENTQGRFNNVVFGGYVGIKTTAGLS